VVHSLDDNDDEEEEEEEEEEGDGSPVHVNVNSTGVWTYFFNNYKQHFHTIESFKHAYSKEKMY